VAFIDEVEEIATQVFGLGVNLLSGGLAAKILAVVRPLIAFRTRRRARVAADLLQRGRFHAEHTLLAQHTEGRRRRIGTTAYRIFGIEDRSLRGRTGVPVASRYPGGGGDDCDFRVPPDEHPDSSRRVGGPDGDGGKVLSGGWAEDLVQRLQQHGDVISAPEHLVDVRPLDRSPKRYRLIL
jgi:hypothetical protein